MKRLLVNDCLSVLADHRTFWNDLKDWFEMDFVGAPYSHLADVANLAAEDASLIVRNATWFPPIPASVAVPTISLLQDIMEDGPMRKMQETVMESSRRVVFNSHFTASKYKANSASVIPLPVDFTTFEPGNPMGLQQALGLPEGCVIWVGACQQAGHIKGFDFFLKLARANPDIPFIAVFKDAMPEYMPPNVRGFLRLSHADLAKVMGACRALLCTSRMESQHLAGIEAGACGLPIVAPPVGVYWQRADMPGILVAEPTIANFTSAIRAAQAMPHSPQAIRSYWRREFAPEVIRGQWKSLIEEVECSGAS